MRFGHETKEMKMSDHSMSRRLAVDGHDSDPQETAEWIESLASLIAAAGPDRVRQI
jgi:hypothetical protein